ncbi:TetR/AcrR family transcriptional regulator [Subtercola boreus]|nr:TetR/AcrR family transcriptional regulator [Subtercola boreus]
MQTVQEIKQLAMDQIRQGGADAVTLSGIVREMSMSPAALYRYFANRDALLADLVFDAYNELADWLTGLELGAGSAVKNLDAVLRGTRRWALEHPNAYRLIFQTTIGSGEEFAADRLIPAASRSMAVIIDALAAVTGQQEATLVDNRQRAEVSVSEALRTWGDRSGLSEFSTGVLALALLTWTRLHGIISLELGGHLTATGIGANTLFDLEVQAIHSQAASLPPATKHLSH